MVAAAIMALAISTSITVLQRGFLSLDTARNITLAGQIMQSELEKMRLKNWTHINAFPTANTEIPIDTSFTSNPFVGNRFKLFREVEEINMGTGVGMRKITLTVQWKSFDARVYSRRYLSYYGQKGLYDYFYNSW